MTPLKTVVALAQSSLAAEAETLIVIGVEVNGMKFSNPERSIRMVASFVETMETWKFPSAPADYGFSFTREWDQHGYSDKLGMTMEEFINRLDEKGLLLNG